MATYIPITDIPEQFFDSAGDPLESGTLEAYLAGTTTATDMFSDNAGTSVGTSITLNAYGYPESGGNTIGLFRDQSKALKLVLKNSAGSTIWTMDDIPATAAFDSTSSEKLGYITVTQAVDLDTMESDLATAYQVDGSVALTAGITMPLNGFLDSSYAAGITASTTQTQGQQALTNEINEVATVANDNDVVTLPTAVAGRAVTIFNNGAYTLQIFPASGDSIDDAAVDVSTTLAAEATQEFVATGSTVWESKITATGTSGTSDTAKYGSFYDEDNTTAFVINAASQKHCYHTAGIVTGASDGWTFDAGGAGTPVAIASIADGAASGVDIEVTTTGNHGLTVGDIVSQTGLADAAYVGVFIVKAIISNTQYEVEAVYTATDTGTMDAAATLTCDVGSDGDYNVSWSASASAATSSDIFDFTVYKNATVLPGSSTRRKFGTGGDVGSMSGVAPVFAANAGDKISFVIVNTSGAGNTTNRHVVVRLEEVVAVDASATAFTDNTFRIRDNSDITKKMAFEVSGVTTGTTRNITIPDEDYTLGRADKTYIDQNLQTGTSYELVLADAGQIVEMNNAAANTLNIPANSAVAFPVDTRIDVIQYGAGTTTITITTDTLTGEVVSTGQYKAMSLWKRAATEWVVIGGTT